MSKESLYQYIREQRDLRVSDEAIKSALLEKNWDEALVKDALLSLRADKSLNFDRLLTVSELAKESFLAYKEKPLPYLLYSAFGGILPLLTIIFFSLPIIYDIIVLKLTLADFIANPLLPFLITYGIIAFIAILVSSTLGNIFLISSIAGECSIRITASLRKSWSLLPGYLWIALLQFSASIASLIPGAALLSIFLLLSKLLQLEPGRITSVFTFLLIALVTIIPLLVVSLYVSFSTYAYIIDGTRGIKALKTSARLIKGNFKRIALRLIALSLISGIAYGIIDVALFGYGGFFANIIVAPFTIFYMILLYKNFHAIKKAEQDTLNDME